MTFPSASISAINRRQGESRTIARTLLFVGQHTKIIKPTPVGPGSDLATLFGDSEKATSVHRHLTAFFANAGQDSLAFVTTFTHPEHDGTVTDAWANAVIAAQAVCSVEGVVVVLDETNDEATANDINKAQSLRTTLINDHQRRTWFLMAVRGCHQGEKWADYLSAMTQLQQGIAAEGVMLTPSLWGNEAGVLAGRLCNSDVTLADSPARVATGPLAMLGSATRPADSEGVAIDIATLKSLAKNRYSVPMWYEDYEGYYWADGVTLDVDGGDYQVIEHLRVADEIARQVRMLAVPRIADRALNSTPGSIATFEQLFAKPMRDGARSLTINGTMFPGLCMSPRPGDVKITWLTPTQAQIAIIVRPYNCPKNINISIMLDESGESK
ncbi:DUF2586 domain-containing protein [Edwardsiella tarda]|uniref:DUF2586 domain-containing protein n=1 Tax=Edwardsiella tarda TaxID=636 RepID=UPI002443F4A5|nr:DUF2586 domain-containing protein [Edwardsiella tarda]WGE29421.1 DUF2586 domain-containing protein [Edwardsiella tarda]